MSVLAVGLSHRSSPVALLERVAMSGEERLGFMTEVAASPSVNEALVVSTCNRMEVYAEVDKFHGGVAAISELLAWRSGVSLAELTEHVYVHYEERAVQHLFSVACGLESMVVGEGQILGQVRSALKDAQHVGALGRVLNDLGQRALRVGKRAHTDTHLDHAGADLVTLGLTVAERYLGPPPGEYGANTAPVAGANARTLAPGTATGCPMGFDDPSDPKDPAAAAQRLAGYTVLILGAGSMSALAANTVARQGASGVVVANRTFERAARLAECLTEAYEPMDGRAVEFAQAADELARVDLVISCTGAQGLVLSHDAVASAAAQRGGRPLVLLDLALPHDVDPAAHDLGGVELIDLAGLSKAAADGTDDIAGRASDISVVRDIVEEEVGEYQAVRRADLVAPTVVALRSKAATVVDTELARLEGRLPELDEKARAEITHAMRRVVDKLLHQPTVRVKELASAPNGNTYEAALRELFDLDTAVPDAVTRLDPTVRQAARKQSDEDDPRRL